MCTLPGVDQTSPRRRDAPEIKEKPVDIINTVAHFLIWMYLEDALMFPGRFLFGWFSLWSVLLERCPLE